MPEFDSRVLSGPAPLAFAYVLSVMLYPHDADARRAAEEAINAEWVAGWLSKLAKLEAADFSVDADIASWLYQAPRLHDVLSVKRLATAMFAGCLLGFVLSAAPRHPKLASVGAYVRGVSKELGQIRRARGNGIETLKEEWSQYSCVAHLWSVAWNEAFWHCAENHELLLWWLAGAEDMRRQGENYVVKGAHAPVLDPRTTWKVPTGLALPASPLIFFAPTPDEIRIVSRGKSN